MQASTASPVYLRDIFQNLTDMNESVNLYIDSEGIRTTFLDQNQVSMVHLVLAAASFEEYRVSKKPEVIPIIACVNINLMYNALRSVQPTNCIVTFSIDEDHMRDLKIEIYDESRDARFEHVIKMWGFTDQRLGFPDTVFDFHIEMPSHEFQRYINYMFQMMNGEDVEKSKKVTIVLQDKKFSLHVDGEYGSSALKIDMSQTGYTLRNGSVDPMSGDFGMPHANENFMDAPIPSAVAAAAAAADSGLDVGGGDDGAENSVDAVLDAPPPSSGSAKKRKKGVPPPPTSRAIKAARSEVVPASNADGGKPFTFRNTFLIKYLKYITRCANVCGTVLLFMKPDPDYPLIFLYRVGTMGKVVFCLMPSNNGDAGAAPSVAEETIVADTSASSAASLTSV